MLCEGQTAVDIGEAIFIKRRLAFFENNYEVSSHRYINGFIKELEILQTDKTYTAILLWFEYDLFCHINMIASIHYLKQLGRKEHLYLVCSGKISGTEKLHGLSELDDDQLIAHYNQKVRLTSTDIALANTLWTAYCSANPNAFTIPLGQTSSFIYLEPCIQAYRERFPNKNTGLNYLESMMLKAIRDQEIATRQELCSYMLRNQGYYGYGDSQLFRSMESLTIFYESTEKGLVLNDYGNAVIEHKDNYLDGTHPKKDIHFGGVNKYDYSYDAEHNQLLKGTS